jgi:hypothetical protein
MTMYLTPMAAASLGLVAALSLTAVAEASLLQASDETPSRTAGGPFVFRDVGDEAGVFPHVAGIRGHGAAWGDSAGTGWPDLFVATFHNAGSKRSLFFHNNGGKFRLDEQQTLRSSGIGSGALFVDLTNSGRLDLYVSHCAYGRDDVSRAPSLLFRNEGGGKFTEVSKESGACPPGYAGRGLATLDCDGDGLLDLLTCERYYGAVKTGPALYRNEGNYHFVNIAVEAGLPAGLSGLGVGSADVNNDGWPDIFLTAGDGNHRLFLNNGKGLFREALGCREVFRWKVSGPEDTPAGVCIADVNNDGWPDIVIGHHTKRPWKEPLPIRLYLHCGLKDGEPLFKDVTEAAGLKPLTMKAPHVEIQDLDNDGLPDIVVSIVKLLKLPADDYSPGKIHGRLDRGDDGWLYFSTHRGSTRATTDQYHYKGDWILRHHPGSGRSEIVAWGPVPKHCIPCSVLDPKRLIFYGGTAAGTGGESEGIQFFAYDVKSHKVLYAGPNGPSRYLIFARSTGRVYFTSGKEDPGPLLRYDPDKGGPPVKTSATLGLRAATQETPQGFVYTVSSGQGGREPMLWSFHTKTEEVKRLGSAAVGSQGYIASIDADPSGRYLYYVPGAHGGSDSDGSPVVQFDVQTGQKKVMAFLHPFYKNKYGCTLRGTYSSAIDPRGDRLYVTWNVSRGSRAWDCVALSVISISEMEREP